MVDLTLVDRISVPFAGLPAREGPLTVGQRNVMQWLGKPGTAAISVYRWAFVIPDGTTIDGARAAFAILLARHEALRTTLHLDGEAVQRVAGEGELSIDVYTSADESDEAVTARLDTRLRARPFDLARELPLRVAMVVSGEAVRLAVAVFTHMALDVGGMALVGRQFTELAAGSAGPAGSAGLPALPALPIPPVPRAGRRDGSRWTGRPGSSPRAGSASCARPCGTGSASCASSRTACTRCPAPNAWPEQMWAARPRPGGRRRSS